MPKRLGSSEVIRVLQEHGFFRLPGGSHAKYKNAAGLAIVPHPRELPIDHALHHPAGGLTPQDFGF